MILVIFYILLWVLTVVITYRATAYRSRNKAIDLMHKAYKDGVNSAVNKVGCPRYILSDIDYDLYSWYWRGFYYKRDEEELRKLQANKYHGYDGP